MPVSSAGRKAGAYPRRRPSHPLVLFFKGFLKHPAMVGSVIPSSRALIDKMLAPVDWEAARLIVEYGPGVGTYTVPILDRLGPDATLIATARTVLAANLESVPGLLAPPAEIADRATWTIIRAGGRCGAVVVPAPGLCGTVTVPVQSLPIGIGDGTITATTVSTIDMPTQP